jgi:hypothetical protein
LGVDRPSFESSASAFPDQAKKAFTILLSRRLTAQARFLLFSHLGSSIPTPFLAVLLFWLTILFGEFALLARPNVTTLAALVVCALSVSGALFLMLELDQPFSGLMAIEAKPLRRALGPINP